MVLKSDKSQAWGEKSTLKTCENEKEISRVCFKKFSLSFGRHHSSHNIIERQTNVLFQQRLSFV